MPQPHGCSDGFPRLSDCDCARWAENPPASARADPGVTAPQKILSNQLGCDQAGEVPNPAIPALCGSADSPSMGSLNSEVLFEGESKSDDDLCENTN